MMVMKQDGIERHDSLSYGPLIFDHILGNNHGCVEFVAHSTDTSLSTITFSSKDDHHLCWLTDHQGRGLTDFTSALTEASEFS